MRVIRFRSCPSFYETVRKASAILLAPYHETAQEPLRFGLVEGSRCGTVEHPGAQATRNEEVGSVQGGGEEIVFWEFRFRYWSTCSRFRAIALRGRGQAMNSKPRK